VITDAKLGLFSRMAVVFKKAGFFEKGLDLEGKVLKRILILMINPPWLAVQKRGALRVTSATLQERRFVENFKRFKRALKHQDKKRVKKTLIGMGILEKDDKENDRIVEVIVALVSGKGYPKRRCDMMKSIVQVGFVCLFIV
jgi:hypothetical protein